jgi:hypothetical protein
MQSKALKAAAARVSAGLIMAGAACAPAMAKPGAIYTVGKVQVGAIAEDAVQAKDKAIAQGQEKALRVLLKRLALFDAYNRFPRLEATQVERMMDGLSVRNERNSATQYLATLDFSFQPNAVKDTLNRFGIAFTDERSPEVVVLPVLVENRAVKPAGRNPWQKAFDGLDVEHMLTPMKIVPPRPDFAPLAPNSTPASASSAIETLKLQYHSQYLVLAYAELEAAAGAMNVRLMGSDASGEVKLSRRYRVFDRDLVEASERAARISAKTIEDRWKLARFASEGTLNGPAELTRVEISAEFAGAKEWRQMRAKLQRAPGLQGFEVKSLNARGAVISLEFPGGADRLARVLQPQGMILEDRGGEWTLTARQ